MPDGWTEADVWRYERIRLAQMFRWPLSEIDKLTAKDRRDIWAVLGAQREFNPKGKWWE